MLQISRLEFACPFGGKLENVSGAIVFSGGVSERYGNANIT
jgi:hypothetical protein